MKLESPEFYDFIMELERVEYEKRGAHYLCLACWRFVSFEQQKQHERSGHQCAKPGSIRDETSFMVAARTFNKISMNGCV